MGLTVGIYISSVKRLRDCKRVVIGQSKIWQWNQDLGSVGDMKLVHSLVVFKNVSIAISPKLLLSLHIYIYISKVEVFLSCHMFQTNLYTVFHQQALHFGVSSIFWFIFNSKICA